ncbi:MAG: hypothetical protein BWY43_00446 [candidate division WS2 bacterium ADurb.Bin280]|uniref:Uncharacterized protein n=1 Tax=candidate division WS2 bacterium ADurb.Bin280 TaxID=1852829 RepID=A0A1V5SDL9_9BACT|nr:MAG: hypothetical protein BWY43_00446 [candidate division WS2 bacterium ADurb.Bin280]
MNLLVKIKNPRLVSVFDGDKVLVSDGELGDLLSLARKYGTMIKRVQISGDCGSYTFKRQVYLFANLMNYFNGEGKQVFPQYNDGEKKA